MKKKEVAGGIIVLFLITGVSGYLLAQVYKVTKPKIEEQKRIEEEKINKEIFPEGVKFEEKRKDEISYVSVYNSDGEEIGKIFKVKTLGYGGYILLKVGVNENFKIKGVKIIHHSETPGLGSKITSEKFLSQFEGKTIDEIYLKKDNPEGKIDGITGATISSRAVVDGIRKFLKKVKK